MNESFFNASQVPAAVVVAGLAGGLAEVLWIGASAMALGVDGWRVVREVAVTVLPVAADSSTAPALGFIVHFVLSIALAAGFVHVLERVRPQTGPGAWLAAAVVSLAIVWSVNFLVVLPWLNPAFVTLLPFGITFISKLLFAVAMWGAFTGLSWSPRLAPHFQ